MSGARRWVIIACSALLTIGCSSVVAGTAVPGTASSDDPASCKDSFIADPWIVFASPLRSEQSLQVGKKGWLQSAGNLANVSAAGDADAVELSEHRAVVRRVCGVDREWAQWVEVLAIKAGTAVITVKSTGAKYTVTVTD